MAIISVIIPVYNSEKHIAECIESVVKQTLKDIEIIIINDGSLDSSYDICKSMSFKDNRITLYNIENSGVSNARNLGIRNSNSDLIMFVDSDDILDTTILEKLYLRILENESDLSMCGYLKKDETSGNKEPIQFNCPNFDGSIQDFFKNILQFYYPPIIQSPCWKIYKKKIIEKNNIIFNSKMNYGEDLDFVLSYLSNCSRITSLDECLYIYRKHSDGSLSRKFNEKKLDINIHLAKKLECVEKGLLEYQTNHSLEIIAKASINYLIELTSFQNSLSKHELLIIIKKMMENYEVEKSLFYMKNANKRFYIYYLLFLTKSPLLLSLAINIQRKIK